MSTITNALVVKLILIYSIFVNQGYEKMNWKTEIPTNCPVGYNFAQKFHDDVSCNDFRVETTKVWARGIPINNKNKLTLFNHQDVVRVLCYGTEKGIKINLVCDNQEDRLNIRILGNL